MLNAKCNEFKYRQLEDSVIIFRKKDSSNNNLKNVCVLVNNTCNTWQKDRDYKEKVKNTFQGKLAEQIFAEFVNIIQKGEGQQFEYISYDDFRDDEFKKHAPLDGILYDISNPYIEEGKKKIIEDVKNNEYGILKTETLAYLSRKKLFTVEVKSSIVPKKDYEGISRDNFSNYKEQMKLIEALRNRDIFTYPKLTRDKGLDIRDWEGYCKYAKENIEKYKYLDDSNLREEVISEELKRNCDIYTRIFIDNTSTESEIGYLTGYALKEDFFINPVIINMPKRNKSEKALYFSYPINDSRNLTQLFSDERLWK